MNWVKLSDKFSEKNVRLLFWLAISTFFLGLFVKLTTEISEHNRLEQIDKSILLFVEKVRVPAFNGIAVDLTALGSPLVITLVTLIGLLVLWLRQDRDGFVYLVTVSFGAGFWTLMMKHLIGRERPQIIPRLVEVSGLSYPSGHSLSAAAVYLGLTFLTCRHFKSIYSRLILFSVSIGLIAAVSLSRVYLGVHYPSDILSGVFLGASWVFFLTAFFTRDNFSEVL